MALKVPSSRESPIVDREKLKQMQREDESLRKYWDRDDVLVKGQAEISFEEKCGVLYRLYKHPYVNGGKPLKQVMVPETLRHLIMEVAHGSIMRRHIGIKKTRDKIQSAFYWPKIQGDVTRFCKPCDVCQKTDHEPLKHMDSAKYTNTRLMRWAMFLQSYSFKVEAIKGSQNVEADYLSRVEE